jgi:hypothetical protein
MHRVNAITMPKSAGARRGHQHLHPAPGLDTAEGPKGLLRNARSVELVHLVQSGEQERRDRYFPDN